MQRILFLVFIIGGALSCINGNGQTVFSENMGTPSGTTSIASNIFQNSGVLSYSGTSDVRNTSGSSGYTGASGAGNVFFAATAGTNFQIASISTVGYSSLSLSFGAYKSTTASNMSELKLEYSTDGSTYNTLTIPPQPTGTGTATWRLISNISLPAAANGVSNLRLRWTNTSSTPQFRIDDVSLQGGSAPYLSISPTSLTGLNYRIGSGPSASQTVTLSAGNLSPSSTGTITTTPTGTTNFEYSLDGGTTWISTFSYGYTASASGAFSKSFLVRLKSGLSSNTYSEGAFNFTNGTITTATGLSLSGSVYNSLATDYFRSKQNGDWSSTTTWESSLNGSSGWVNADLVPGSAAADVYISHTVSITSNVTVNKTRVANTLLLLNGTMNTSINSIPYNGTYNGILNLYDGGATDELTILNAGKLQAVSTSANYTTAVQYNTSGNINVNTGGTILIGDGSTTHSVGGYYGFGIDASNHVIWNNYSIFEWNSTNSQFLLSNNATYFPSVNSTTIPILKVSATTTGTWGGSQPTTINGLLEVDALDTLKGAGNKTIRDGITGSGTLVLMSTGTNLISASTAVLDGTSLTLKLLKPLTINGIAVPSGANIKIDDASAANILLNNKNFNVDAGGTFDIGSTSQLSGSGTVTVSGTFKTANANGFSGAASASVPTASVTINSGSIIEYNATGNQTFTGRSDYSGIAISGANTSKKIMNGNATASGSLILNNGVLVTGDHLFSWNYSAGALTQPSTYTDSYICTCDATGKETTLKDGTAGFRINNVGGSSDVFFPVGTDYISPNRMAINMNGSTTDNFTVVVGKGDVGNTPWPKVNRIWYVKEETPDGSTANMKLFFTERDASQFLSGQDEIETGFDYTKIALLQKGYTDPNFYNASSSSDIQSFPNGAYDNQEVYALYTFGVSPDVNGNKFGIDTFTRFSVVGADLSNIILPVSITGLKAYQNGNTIKVDWTALNEIAVDHYEVEKSANAISFASIINLKARNNGNARNDYFITDNNPANGKNFYRIKIFDKNGHVATTGYVVVNIENGKVSVTILPNPVRNKTLVTSFNNVPAGKYQMVLYSSSGQKIYQQIIEHVGGSSSQTIKLPAVISHGVYILKVFSNSNNFSQKILIE